MLKFLQFAGILLLLALVHIPCFSQTETTVEDLIIENNATSIENQQSISLIDDFYSMQGSLERTYDYERIRKIKRLRTWSNEILAAGLVVTLGTSFLAGFLSDAKSLGWVLPTVICIGTGSIVGTVFWSKHLRERAKALEETPVYTYNISPSLQMQAVVNTMHIGPTRKYGVGIGINKTF